MIDPTENPSVPVQPEANANADASATNDTTPATPETAADTPPPVDPVEATLAAMNGGAVPAAEPVAAAPDADAVPATPTAPVVPDPAREPAKPTPEQVKAQQDAEIADLGLDRKDKRTEARFRELHSRASEVEPLKAQVQQLGVYRQQVEEWEDRIVSTGATPEQYGGAMNYLTLLNSGKPENLEIALEQVEGEYLALCKALGRPTSAGYDPIADHPDIAAKLANMDIDRDTALEVIAARNRTKVELASRQTQQQQDGQQDIQAQGRNEMVALETELRVTDPAYAEKLTALTPALQAMTKVTSPDKWAAAARRMFAALNIPKAAPQPAPRTVSPLRPASTGASHVRVITDPVEATLAAMGGSRQL